MNLQSKENKKRKMPFCVVEQSGIFDVFLRKKSSIYSQLISNFGRQEHRFCGIIFLKKKFTYLRYLLA